MKSISIQKIYSTTFVLQLKRLPMQGGNNGIKFRDIKNSILFDCFKKDFLAIFSRLVRQSGSDYLI